MNVAIPMNTTDRQTTASDSFTKDLLSSTPCWAEGPEPPGVLVSSARRTGRHRTLPTRAGTARNGVNRRSCGAITAATRSGASANPTLPPTENQLIAVWLPRPALRATRADSGWYAATPTPETATNTSVSA